MRFWRSLGGLLCVILVALAFSHLKQGASFSRYGSSRTDFSEETDKQGWQRAKASMRLRIRGSTSGDASLSSATAGGDLQRVAAEASSQEGGDIASLSDVVKAAGKAQAAGQKPSERLRAIGLDPATWTMDPWKHMQRKEIPTRYDSQLEEYDDSLYDDSQPLADRQENFRSSLQGSRADERSATQQKESGEDAGTIRSGLLAEITEQLIPGAREKGTLPLPGVGSGSSSGGRDQQSGEQASRGAELGSRDQRDSSSLTSEGSQVDKKTFGSREAGLSSDSAAGVTSREAAKTKQGGLGSDSQGQAQLEQRQGLIEGKRGTTSFDGLVGARDGLEDESASDEGQRAGRRARHGQRPNASGDRAGVAAAKRQKGSSGIAMPADDDDAAEEGTGRTGRSAAQRKPGTATDKGTKGSRRGASGVATYAADNDDDRDSDNGDVSSSTAQGVAGSAADKSVRGSTKSAGQSQRAASEPEDGKNRKKAAPKVRPALKGYKLSWDVLEADQSSSTETLSDDPTRWSWTPSKSSQPGPLVSLTAELVRRSSRDRAVIVTWASSAYLDFLQNWVHHLTSMDVDNILIGAMDETAAAYLHERELPYFTMFGQGSRPYKDLEGTLEKDSQAARTLAFNKIGIAKAITGFGIGVIMSDADVVWQRDPTDYCTSVLEADILMATDALGPSNSPDDDGLETPDRILYSDLSTGILYFRSSPGAQQFLGSWDAALQGGSNVTEQGAFNTVVRRGMRPLKTHAGNYRVFYGMDSRATFGVLPLAGFLNGHGYFVQRLHEVMRTSPYGVHTDYIFGGLTAKRNRLREAQIWLDAPSYYSSPRLLQVDIHVPAVPDNFERLRSDYMVELHLKVMQHQLDQMVAAFSLAMLLNRTLVMPKFVCFCDRFWAPLDRCRAPGGGRLGLPFVCPLDHIFKPAQFADEPALHGPPLFVREHSFLENPNVPTSVFAGELELVLAKTPAPGEDATPVLMGKQLYFPQQRTDEDLLKLLQPYQNAQLLTVGRVTGMMKGFAAKETAEGFWRRMEHIMGLWCCNYDGGIKYSMLPHVTPAEDEDTDEELADE